MNEGSLKKELILNGTNSVAVLKEDGAIYRIDGMSIIQEINFYSIEKNRTKIIRLDDRLNKDYEILGITADIPDDDGDVDTATSNPGEQAMVRMGVRIFSGVKATENVKLQLTSYPFYTNKLFINHRDTWHIKCDRTVSRITFKCKPVYMEQPVVFP